MTQQKPNVIFVFGDQWRADALGYNGDPNVKTPHLDRLSRESVNFTNAIAGCPVCTPYRASLITGQYPLTHGLFLNDLCLSRKAVSIADAFSGAGYDTAYIGKWHIDGHGRSAYIPRERRQGFDYWKVLECTHDYQNSFYYGDEDIKLKWEGYDAIAQTRDAQQYIRNHDSADKPFFMVLSWGPPHNPYTNAPDQYKAMYRFEDMKVRPNVPADPYSQAQARNLPGYYAHITALDDCIGDLLSTIRESGIEENTLFVFTSDHGDMMGSHGLWEKQRPEEESIHVPFLLRYPALLGKTPRQLDAPINAPDIMPTLLGLCGIDIPSTAEGMDFSNHIQGGPNPGDNATLIGIYAPFGTWPRAMGGREWRGVRTTQYTYVRDLAGPWLLYDNANDPYQMDNLLRHWGPRSLQKELDAILQEKLRQTQDDFQHGDVLIRKWGYTVDANGTVPYSN